MGRFVLKIGLSISLLLCLNTRLAAQNIQATTQIFHIRQITTRRNGVLVSKPSALDEHIALFLKINRICNIEDYARWLKDNISYKKKYYGSLWPSPQQTLKEKNGNCKDFAALNASVLRVFGFTPKIIAYFKPKIGHAITTFKKDKNF